MGYPGLSLGDSIHLPVSEMDAVCVPHVIARPAQIFHELHRPPAELFDAEAFLVQSLGKMGVQTDAVAARQVRRVAHELWRDRERRAWSDRHAAHRSRSRIVEAFDLRSEE